MFCYDFDPYLTPQQKLEFAEEMYGDTAIFWLSDDGHSVFFVIKDPERFYARTDAILSGSETMKVTETSLGKRLREKHLGK